MAAVIQNKRTYNKEKIHYLQKENSEIVIGMSYKNKIPTIKSCI